MRFRLFLQPQHPTSFPCLLFGKMPHSFPVDVHIVVQYAKLVFKVSREGPMHCTRCSPVSSPPVPSPCRLALGATGEGRVGEGGRVRGSPSSQQPAQSPAASAQRQPAASVVQQTRSGEEGVARGAISVGLTGPAVSDSLRSVPHRGRERVVDVDLLSPAAGTPLRPSEAVRGRGRGQECPACVREAAAVE